jgi:hypothetical protein
VLIRLAIALVALTVSACSMLPLTPSSAAPCAQAGLRTAQSEDPNAMLVAAFVASAADVASWESTGYGNATSVRIAMSPSRDPGRPLDRVDVCWYEGAFYIGGHPVVPVGGTIRPWDRLLVLVNADDGVARIATAGFRETTPLASPPRGP